MSLHYFSFHTTIRSSAPGTTSSDDSDLVRLNIRFEHQSAIPVVRGPQGSERIIACSNRKSECSDKSTCVCVRRSELGCEDAIMDAITAFLKGTVPELWQAEMADELMGLARSMRKHLSSIEEQATPLVEVHLRTLAMQVKAKDKHGGDGLLPDYLLEQLTELVKANSFKTISRPATLSSVKALETVPKNQLDVEDRCTICMDEYATGGEVVLLPCSHKYHRDCIAKWMHVNHACPLCRFEMPHEVTVLHPTLMIRRETSH